MLGDGCLDREMVLLIRVLLLDTVSKNTNRETMLYLNQDLVDSTWKSMNSAVIDA